MSISARGSNRREEDGRGESFAPPTPLRPQAEPSAVELIGQIGSIVDAHLAQIDGQIAIILKLLSHPGPAPIAEPAPSTDSLMTVCCLGSFQFSVDGNPVGGWRSSKARALFQYLINHRGRPIPRDTLIQALWPNPDAVAAGTSLKVAVHALRQTLNLAGTNGACLTIQAHDCGYQLNAPHLWVDVEDFDRCYALGRSFEAQGLMPRALALYARAADLYRGDFLEELSDDWPMFRREALKDQYLYILACLAKAAVESGDYQGGIVRCQQLLAKDRCREDAYRLLMVCHSRLGQRGRVRAWFEFCLQTLRTELDCVPELETERVFRLALAGKV